MNLSDREQELLQKALFEELTRHEQQELDALLARTPAVRHKLEGLKHTAWLAASIPQQQPATALQARILASLPPQHEDIAASARSHTPPPRLAAALRERCPYYFFLAGVLHLLLGAALRGLLQGVEAVSDASGWILWQPEFAFVTGAFFLICGVLLLRQTPHAARISYGGLMVYIIFVAVNTLALLQFSTRDVLPGLLAFAGMGLTIGALLGALLQTANKDMGDGSV